MPENLQGLDRIAAPVITPDIRELAIARIRRESDSELLMDILGLGE